jgi:ornithine cyclodeaminase
MTKTFNLDQIKQAMKNIDVIKIIEEGFVAYSQGKVVVPPVGEMIFEEPPGETHIKYGFIKNDDYYVIKIASGFYGNYKLDLPSNYGLMLLFSQKTGFLSCILFDEGWLTAVRTATAGAVAARYLAPKNISRIGIFGAGEQGRLQLGYLKGIVDCRDVIAWGVNREELDVYKKDMEAQGFIIQTTLEADDITSSCNFIVTATPSKKPLVRSELMLKGTHITAMGSDTPAKQELESDILQKADIVVADSLSQCKLRGEIFKALEAGAIKAEKPVELGNVIMNKELQRGSDDQITVADLTGVAVQDYQISKAVYEELGC